MPTTPIIESLGRSLDHWQFLYILAITIALLSTFAIVIFAFHIEQHRAGLKVSNYIYVIGSLLAVVSSIVIVVKTKSLDAEKDRVSSIAIGEAKTQASRAYANAETARGNAETAREKAEEARKNAEIARKEADQSVIDKEKIAHDNLQLQKQVEGEKTARVQLERSLAPRGLTPQAQGQMIQQLLLLPPQVVDMVTYTGNSESQQLANQVAFALQAAHWKFFFYAPLGGSVQGVFIEFDPKDPNASKAAGIVSTALQSSGIAVTNSPNLPPFGDQLGAYSSGPGATGSGKIRIFFGSK